MSLQDYAYTCVVVYTYKIRELLLNKIVILRTREYLTSVLQWYVERYVIHNDYNIYKTFKNIKS